MKKQILPTILFSMFLTCGCGAVAQSSLPAEPSPTQAVTEGTGSSTGTVTVDLGNAADDNTAAIQTGDDPGFLAEFPFDTGTKKEYTVSDNIVVKASSFDQMEEFADTQAIILNLNGSSLDISTAAGISNEVKEEYISEAVTIEGRRICIGKSGTYILRGILDDGQICFRGNAEDKIQLVLDGAEISCSTGAPLFFESGDKALITLAPGSENFMNDGVLSEDKGCIFSRIDLTINGSGSLQVNAVENNGISCKDDLKILNGNIAVYAGNHALKGNDSVSILGGVLTLSAKKDGICSDKEEDPEKGFLYLDGGKIEIAADDDGLQAVTAVVVKEGTDLRIRCYDSEIHCDGYVERP